MDEKEVTLSDLVERFKLVDERLDKPCTAGHLASIALCLTTWEIVSTHLGLDPPEIEAIESDAKSTEEKRQKMLQKWGDKFAHKATYRRLIMAFLKIKNAELATKVCQLLVSKQCKFITH